MKISIERDERYPEYSFAPPRKGSPTYEVRTATLERWQRVTAMFNGIQNEMYHLKPIRPKGRK